MKKGERRGVWVLRDMVVGVVIRRLRRLERLSEPQLGDRPTDRQTPHPRPQLRSSHPGACTACRSVKPTRQNSRAQPGWREGIRGCDSRALASEGADRVSGGVASARPTCTGLPAFTGGGRLQSLRRAGIGEAQATRWRRVAGHGSCQCPRRCRQSGPRRTGQRARAGGARRAVTQS